MTPPMTDKMRSDFEAAAVNDLGASYSLRFNLHECGWYLDPSVESMWQGYQLRARQSTEQDEALASLRDPSTGSEYNSLTTYARGDKIRSPEGPLLSIHDCNTGHSLSDRKWWATPKDFLADMLHGPVMEHGNHVSPGAHILPYTFSTEIRTEIDPDAGKFWMGAGARANAEILSEQDEAWIEKRQKFVNHHWGNMISTDDVREYLRGRS